MPAASKRRRSGWASWERRGHALLPMPAFLRRLAISLALGLAFIVASLLVGMAGYAYFAGMDATDAFLNASMILGGMGPVAELHTRAAKIFAGLYALYSGLAVLAAAGVVSAPLVHRLLHRFHADEKDLLLDEPGEESEK
jgi:hypothetical protein